MNDTARTEVDRRETSGTHGGPGGDAVARRAAAFARELGAVGEVGWLLAKRAAVLADRMEHLAERDAAMVAVNVQAARDQFDDDRRAERAGWASDLNGIDPGRIAEALAHLELSGPGLDLLHRLWGRLLEGVRSDDPAAAASASAQARKWLGAMGEESGAPGDAAGLAARVVAEAARLRTCDERTREALEQVMAAARREAGLATSFDPSPEASRARRHEAAAERGFFRALGLIRALRRDAGLAAIAEAEARAPLPTSAPAQPIPAPRPTPPAAPTRSSVPDALGSFQLGIDSSPFAVADALGSFRVGAAPDRPRRPDLAKVGGKRR